MLIQAAWFNTIKGRLYIFDGGSSINTSPNLIIDGIATGNSFPSNDSDYTIEDLDKDGYQDIIAGSRGYNSDAGRGFIFWGSNNLTGNIDTNSANVTLDGNLTDKKYFGAASAVGDFNGDSYDDILTSERYTNKGKVYIFYGGADMSTSYGVKFNAEVSSDYLTRSSTAIGDINHDGKDDFCMGAYRNSSNTGRVYCILGLASLTGDKSITTADYIVSGASANDNFGRTLDLYDVNNDGNLDLIVGAYQNTGSLNGYVNIYFGNGTTFSTTADKVINASDIGESGKLFGVQVKGGDLKNSGWPELFIISAWTSSAVGARVHIFDINHGTPMVLKEIGLQAVEIR